VACLALNTFPYYPQDFRKIVSVQETSFDFLYHFPFYVELNEMQSKMYIDPQVKYPLFLSDFNETYFLDRFSKNTPIQIFTKIRQLGAELLHAEGDTDMTKLIVVFRNFANPHKNDKCLLNLFLFVSVI
jgi:hypothetical protein